MILLIKNKGDLICIGAIAPIKSSEEKSKWTAFNMCDWDFQRELRQLRRSKKPTLKQDSEHCAGNEMWMVRRINPR